MERAEDEVPRLRRSYRGRHGLGVAHLSDERHINVLAEHRLERGVEVVRVKMYLALVNDATLCFINVFNRVLDGDDVLGALAADVVNQ